MNVHIVHLELHTRRIMLYDTNSELIACSVRMLTVGKNRIPDLEHQLLLYGTSLRLASNNFTHHCLLLRHLFVALLATRAGTEEDHFKVD
jgi:hypothetical protein